MNLSEFYSYRLIGKLTAFLHLQEFCQRNQIVDSSTTAARFFFLCSNLGLEMFSPRLHFYVLILIWTGRLSYRSLKLTPHTHPTLSNFSCINLVFVCRCSSSTTNPVSVRRVDSSFLVFNLSSHRYLHISLLFSSRFIGS